MQHTARASVLLEGKARTDILLMYFKLGPSDKLPMFNKAQTLVIATEALALYAIFCVLPAIWREFGNYFFAYEYNFTNAIPEQCLLNIIPRVKII